MQQIPTPAEPGREQPASISDEFSTLQEHFNHRTSSMFSVEQPHNLSNIKSSTSLISDRTPSGCVKPAKTAAVNRILSRSSAVPMYQGGDASRLDLMRPDPRLVPRASAWSIGRPEAVETHHFATGLHTRDSGCLAAATDIDCYALAAGQERISSSP